MKCAFGENPKRCYRDKCDSTRMSTAAFLRGALMQARDYGARKQAANGDVTKMPAYNQKLEALLPVLAREIPLKAHAHQANDIFTALRIAREFESAPDAGARDRGTSHCGRAGKRKGRADGCRPEPDICQQV